jgi:acyl-CoA thioesterase-1
MNKSFFYCLASLTILISSCQKNASLLPSEDKVASQSVATASQLNSAVVLPINIVIIGASTAAGRGATPIDSSWVNRLIRKTATNPTPIKYTNLAKGGLTSYAGMPTGFIAPSGRPAPDKEANITKALSLHPDLVMITFPSNDIANGYSGDEVVNNYKVISHLLDSAKIPFIMFGTQPRDLGDYARRLALKQLSTRIASIYTTKSNDYFDKLSKSDYTIKSELAAGDGIHVNNKGHFIILQTVLNHPVFQAVIHGRDQSNPVPIGKVVSFKSSTNQFASSENGTTTMHCNRNAIANWEKFTIVDAGDRKISLMNNGKYISSKNGTAPIRCDRQAIAATEKFDWIVNANGTVSLRGNNGAYISSENGKNPMTCNRFSVTTNEMFTIN